MKKIKIYSHALLSTIVSLIFLNSQSLNADERVSVEKNHAQDPRAQVVTVADKVVYTGAIVDVKSIKSTDKTAIEALDTHKIIIHKPGASFIKIHFSNFTIPNESYVEVKNTEGTQVHTYGTQNPSLMTTDKAAGDNGSTQFSALSIIGDTAIVEYHSSATRPQPYSVEVDYIMEGYPQETVEHLMYFAGSEDVNQLSTCGAMERRDVQCWSSSHPVQFERSRPVARILMNGSGLCTTWRVGADNHMFTNNHCVGSQSTLSNSEIWFNYQRKSCGGGALEQTVIVTGDTLLRTDYTLDYTLFSVNNFNSISSFGHFGLDVRNAVSQEIIYIPQHGSGNPKELSIESDMNVGGLCRVDSPVTSGRGSDTDTGYMCDTIGGSSGSPVVAGSSNNVIALHHYGGCENSGVRIVKIWPQVSSYFDGVIPGSDNGDNPTPTPLPGKLEKGVSVSDLSGSRNDESHFWIDVPEGANVTFDIRGGSGDADIYVRYGAAPSTQNYDCRPYLYGNTESCSFSQSQSGRYYVMIRAYSDYSGAELVADYTQ